MKKGLKVFLIIVSIVLIICASLIVICCIKKNEYDEFMSKNIFPKNTTICINDINIKADEMSSADVYEKYMLETEETNEFIVYIGEKAYSIDLKPYFKHTLEVSDIEQYIGQEEFIDYIKETPFTYNLKDEYNYIGNASEKLRELIDSKQYDYVESQDAFFDKENIEVVKEVYGTELNAELSAEVMENALKNNVFEADLRDEKLYVHPEIKEEELLEKYKDVLNVLNWKAEYEVSDYVIKLSDYKDKITVNDDGTYKIDNSFLKQAVLGLSKTIDNTYESITFDSKKDGEITVKGGTYGQIMSNSKEIEFLKEKLSKNESVVDRTPIWICEPLIEGENPKNYIEVDISEQHVWHYANGKLCCETDCVTGNSKLKHDTPTGAYYVTEKIPGKYLTGEDYKTWVNRWMRLTNSGVGLHDAGWKKKFGGDIYKTNGSHGCINLPPKYAYSLFDEIEVGILVVIHK